MISVGEWARWLRDQERQTLDAFLTKPMLAFSMYQQERSTSKDYHGREVLELLQNAADQAVLAKVRGKVHIELASEYLLFANNGTPFSKKGVQSLQNPHVSAKRSAKLVGNKGLGFRSILNWSFQPAIFSGNLTLAYTREKLRSLEQALTSKSEQYAKELSEGFSKGESPRLPLLPFPLFGDEENPIELSSFNSAMISRCETLKKEGFDTVIAMPFTNVEAFKNADEQLSKLDIELLLFVKGLGEIDINRNVVTTRFSRKKRGDQVSLFEDKKLISRWFLYESTGDLPDSMQDVENDTSGFELAVAVPMDDLPSAESGFLYTYFSTQLEVPIRSRCHATLELNQSRNHLIDSDKNEFIIKELAKFVAEVAEIATDTKLANTAYLLAKPEGDAGKDKHQQQFRNELLAALRVKCIVPTISGEVVCPENAIGILNADNDWMPKRHFPDVIHTWHDGDNEFFESIGVDFLNDSDVIMKLITLTDLSTKERAQLIWGVESYAPNLAHPGLLIAEGEVESDSRVFTFSEQLAEIVLPNWSRILLLDEELKEEMLQKFELKDQRELQQKLADFGLREYSLSGTIESVISDANKEKKDKSKTKIINTELLRFLSKFFRQFRSRNLPLFPADLGVPLPTQKKGFSSSRKLYLGRGCGTKGEILQGLYGKVDKSLLIVNPVKLLPDLQEDQFSDFLTWIGVADAPRITRTGIATANKEYTAALKEAIRLPVRFEEYEVTDRDELSKARVADIVSVDRLDKFLENGRYESIIAWLATDTRLPGLKAAAKENARVSLRRNWDRNRRRHYGPVLSYVSWSLQCAAWMISKDGRRHSPNSCVIGNALVETAFPKPKLLTKKQVERFGLSVKDTFEAFRTAGVITSLDDLSNNEFYQRLLELPEIDPEGSTARSLYLAALSNDYLSIDNANESRQKFLKDGMMWGVCGTEEGYFPLEELHYIDSEGLPPSLLDQIAIISLPKKRGAKKIQTIFGLQIISKAALEQHVRQHVPSNESATDFEEAKPYFYLLRTDVKRPELERLRNLELVFCNSAQCEFIYMDKSYRADLQSWDWVIDGNKLFIVVDPENGVDPDFVSDSIGAAIASLFGLASGDEFARVFHCKPKNRRSMLEKMRGEAVTENIEEVLKEFAIYESHEIDDAATWSISDPEESLEEPDDETGTEETFPAKPVSAPADGELKITELEYTPKPPRIEVPLSVRKLSNRKRTPGGYQQTDANLCEKLAYEFEEIQGRFPLKVGHIVGNQAFGCDILSFDSEGRRSLFKTGENRELNNIERYIEVKGRKSGSADIELKGNELKSALKNHKKYYLYRLFETSQGEFELGILRAPLKQKDAIQKAYYIDLLRAAKTERFQLYRDEIENTARATTNEGESPE
jgi:hypothetical protein